jgi:uncharacterized protein DUF2460
MATFPTLKTGAVAQYPAPRRLRFQNQVLRFLDGSEQRYRGYSSALREWTIRLDLLDDAELAALRDFFETQKGAFGSFTFVDPQDNTAYADCSFTDDRMSMELEGESRGRTTLVIRENRS